MATDPVPAEIRRTKMLAMIHEREFMRVSDLSRLLGISEVTVRSDLDRLAGDGKLRRVHGGAVAAEAAPLGEPSLEEAVAAQSREKTAIGRATAALIAPGETLILDVGSTTTAVARALVARVDLQDLVVFTNGLTIAMELEPALPRISVVVTGGTLRSRQHSLVEPMAGLVLSEINVSKSILGCNGIHSEVGITNVNLPEAGVKRRMVEAGRQTIVVADGSKLGKISVARVADITEVDTIVTDATAPPELVAEFRSLGIEVEVAE